MSLRTLFQSAPPEVAIAIDSAQVSAARLAWRGGQASVANHAAEALPPGVVTPSLTAPNIADVALVGQAVAQAARHLGRVTRAALVIPDTAAKVSLVRFENVPPRLDDLSELVRWQVRKSAPFPIEQAVVTFTPGAKTADGAQEFVVTLARTDIVHQYEESCRRAGVHPGLVDIATASIVNGVLAGAAAGGDPSGAAGAGGDWLLVHATSTYTTLVVLRGADVIFYRNREQDSEATLADVIHQTAMYYEDRLKGSGFTRVLLAGGALEGVDEVRRSLEQRLEVRIELVDEPALASLVGILARERRAA